MSISHKFSLMCDEVRQEMNGKFIVLGLYTPNITITSLPAILPSLTFLQNLEADRVEAITQRITLQSLETGRAIASATTVLNVQPQPNQPAPWTVLNVINFRNIMFDRAGTYSLTVFFEGQHEPLIQQFDVILNLPGQQPGPQGFGVRR